MMKTPAITPISQEFDFKTVPSWYVLCTNNACPLRQDCMRFHAGFHAPDSLESAHCVMPNTLKDGRCRWFDLKMIVVNAYGFSHLYDQVLKRDYTSMRKSITNYLHGTKMYYEYKRGERPLSPEQQQQIQLIVNNFGYDWEVVFDRYAEAYKYGIAPQSVE